MGDILSKLKMVSEKVGVTETAHTIEEQIDLISESLDKIPASTNIAEALDDLSEVAENINKPYFIKVRFSDGSVKYYTDSTDAKTAIKADDTPKALYIGDVSLGTMEGASTFNGCDALIEVNLGKYLTQLAIGCFANCDNLTTIKIPNQMNFIANNAFAACPNLTKIIVDRPKDSISNAPWGADNATIIWTGTPAPDDGGEDNPK